jgi:hypothetical protein
MSQNRPAFARFWPHDAPERPDEVNTAARQLQADSEAATLTAESPSPS